MLYVSEKQGPNSVVRRLTKRAAEWSACVRIVNGVGASKGDDGS